MYSIKSKTDSKIIPINNIIASNNQINQETLMLQHGQAKIVMTANGTIKLQNSCATIELNADGTIKICGTSVWQTSEQNTYISAKQHIHLNTPP